MSSDMFEIFLQYINKGATEDHALFLAGYDRGYFSKEELVFKFGILPLSGTKREDTREWRIPTDPFEKIVYVQNWNMWLEDRMWKMIHNVQVEMKRANLLKTKIIDRLFKVFPKNIEELRIEKRLKAISDSPGGEHIPFQITKVPKSTTSVFALQCLLQCSADEIKRILRITSRPQLTCTNGSTSKCLALKSELAKCGIIIEFHRQT